MKLGFIGTGNMAGAIMGGIIKKGIIPAEEIIGSDIMETGRNHVKELYGIQVTADNKEVAEKADILVLSVKPQFYAETIQEIRESVREDQMVITIAPGKTLAWLEEQFGKPVRIVRTMPNTPALVGEGMTAACPNQYVTEKDKAYALKLLGAFGKVEVVPEHMIDAVVAVSGSSPAYVFMFIEAMADAGVKLGLSRAKAYKLAEQSILGSAKLALETGKHPGVLKDEVCSPGGTTIEAVIDLEKNGFRNTVISAIEKCANKSKNI